jgi:hypothetical protein
MEIFFYGVGIFCLFASIGANFYFLYQLKLVHGSILDVSEELEEFRHESMITKNDTYDKLKYFSENITVLNTKIEECHEELKKKATAEVRKNNWDSVREAFTRSTPKIQIQERK